MTTSPLTKRDPQRYREMASRLLDDGVANTLRWVAAALLTDTLVQWTPR
ncbi:hypothetical protein [Mesorhizobium sp.]|nr:hypothetical protein [Mesorhizobium sp.]